jgi:hypothetical protein
VLTTASVGGRGILIRSNHTGPVLTTVGCVRLSVTAMIACEAYPSRWGPVGHEGLPHRNLRLTRVGTQD